MSDILDARAALLCTEYSLSRVDQYVTECLHHAEELFAEGKIAGEQAARGLYCDLEAVNLLFTEQPLVSEYVSLLTKTRRAKRSDLQDLLHQSALGKHCDVTLEYFRVMREKLGVQGALTKRARALALESGTDLVNNSAVVPSEPHAVKSSRCSDAVLLSERALRALLGLCFVVLCMPVVVATLWVRLTHPILRKICKIPNGSLPVDRIQRAFSAGCLACWGVTVEEQHVVDSTHASKDTTASRSPVDIVKSSGCVGMFSHGSSLDPFIVASIPKLSFKFIGKKSLFWLPVIGQVMRAWGHLAIDRRNFAQAKKSIARAMRKIGKYCRSIGIFPEGTRSPTGRLVSFKKGAFHMAVESGVPVVPILLENAYSLWRPHHLLPTPGTVRAVLITPVRGHSSGTSEVSNAGACEEWAGGVESRYSPSADAGEGKSQCPCGCEEGKVTSAGVSRPLCFLCQYGSTHCKQRMSGGGSDAKSVVGARYRHIVTTGGYWRSLDHGHSHPVLSESKHSDKPGDKPGDSHSSSALDIADTTDMSTDKPAAIFGHEVLRRHVHRDMLFVHKHCSMEEDPESKAPFLSTVTRPSYLHNFYCLLRLPAAYLLWWSLLGLLQVYLPTGVDAFAEFTSVYGWENAAPWVFMAGNGLCQWVGWLRGFVTSVTWWCMYLTLAYVGAGVLALVRRVICC